MGNISIKECYKIHDDKCCSLILEIKGLIMELRKKGLDPVLENFIKRKEETLSYHEKERFYYRELIKDEELWQRLR